MSRYPKETVGKAMDWDIWRSTITYKITEARDSPEPTIVETRRSCAMVVDAPVAPILNKTWAPTPTQIVPARAK